MPDAELDSFVDAFAWRIASFNPEAVATTKHLFDKNRPNTA
jgi:hypothetical protein